MNGAISNYLRWALVIGFLIVPPLLVRTSLDDAVVRIASYFLLLLAVIFMCAYFGFKRGSLVADMPIAKDLKTEKSKQVAEIVFRGLPIIFLIGGLVMMFNFVPSMFIYISGRATATSAVHIINQINSPAMPGAFFVYMSILTDDKKTFSFSYPDQILQVGHKYLFRLSPNSNFVLSAQPL